MRTLIAAVLVFLALAASSIGQAQPARYQANKTTALVSAGEKVTVQATTTSGAVQFESADVYCSVACDVTVYQNGTAATTTALGVTGPIGPSAAIAPNAYSSSNVGTGTTLKIFSLPAGETMPLNLSAFSFAANAGGTANLSIGVSAITGTARIQVQWVSKL